jgi:hypothetical protein
LKKTKSGSSKKVKKSSKSAVVKGKGTRKVAAIPQAKLQKGGVKLPSPLSLGDVYKVCETDMFKFSTTSKIGESHEFISQDRAVRAINMGLGIRKPGYNIYVAGAQGTGKTSVIRTFL